MLRVVVLLAFASACATYSESTLSERLAERRATQEAAAPDQLAFVESGDDDNSTALALHSGPGSGFDVLVDEVDSGSLRATGNVTGAWTEVRYGDFIGWVVPGAGIFIVPEADDGGTSSASLDPVHYVVGDTDVGVNLREQPDSASKLVGGAPVGSEVVGTGMTSGSWVEVTFADVTGWAWGGYLQPSPA